VNTGQICLHVGSISGRKHRQDWCDSKEVGEIIQILRNSRNLKNLKVLASSWSAFALVDRSSKSCTEICRS
jgi:hypothetical protein